MHFSGKMKSQLPKVGANPENQQLWFENGSWDREPSEIQISQETVIHLHYQEQE